MSDANVLEILLLAMVAGFIILRLRSVLGRRTGHEPPPKPLTMGQDRPAADRSAQPKAGDDRVVALPDRTRREPNEAQRPTGEALLGRLAAADPRFDTKQFLAGAKAAYEMIVTAFATGNRGALRPLLNDDVYQNFARAIDSRDKAGQKLETTLISIKRTDIVDVEIKGRTAEVTVKFVAEMVNATRDSSGAVVGGNPNAVDEVTDIWTFARDVRSSDPNWLLVATSTQA